LRIGSKRRKKRRPEPAARRRNSIFSWIAKCCGSASVGSEGIIGERSNNTGLGAETSRGGGSHRLSNHVWATRSTTRATSADRTGLHCERLAFGNCIWLLKNEEVPTKKGYLSVPQPLPAAGSCARKARSTSLPSRTTKGGNASISAAAVRKLTMQARRTNFPPTTALET